MCDYVKREDAMRVALWFGNGIHDRKFIKKRVMEIPAADVVERKIVEGLEQNAYEEGYAKGLEDCQNCEYRINNEK